MTREEAEKKCYELIHEALRVARKYDPDVHHVSAFVIDDGPGDCCTSMFAYKHGDVVDVRVLNYCEIE